jgi:hypothetical protein
MLALPTAVDNVRSRIPSLTDIRELANRRSVKALAAGMSTAMVLAPQFITHASTAITIDTDTLFESVNDWINVFLPIAAIGLGIAIALAVISYVGDAVLHGFSRSRR